MEYLEARMRTYRGNRQVIGIVAFQDVGDLLFRNHDIASKVTLHSRKGYLNLRIVTKRFAHYTKFITSLIDIPLYGKR
jgi:hypothetical protein